MKLLFSCCFKSYFLFSNWGEYVYCSCFISLFKQIEKRFVVAPRDRPDISQASVTIAWLSCYLYRGRGRQTAPQRSSIRRHRRNRHSGLAGNAPPVTSYSSPSSLSFSSSFPGFIYESRLNRTNGAIGPRRRHNQRPGRDDHQIFLIYFAWN